MQQVTSGARAEAAGKIVEYLRRATKTKEREEISQRDAPKGEKTTPRSFVSDKGTKEGGRREEFPSTGRWRRQSQWLKKRVTSSHS